VRTSAAVVSESSSAARTAEAGTCDRDADAAGNAVTSLIPETGRSAGEWATGGGALTAPTCGAARAGGPGAPWRGSTGAGAGIGAVDGRPYPVSRAIPKSLSFATTAAGSSAGGACCGSGHRDRRPPRAPLQLRDRIAHRGRGRRRARTGVGTATLGDRRRLRCRCRCRAHPHHPSERTMTCLPLSG